MEKLLGTHNSEPQNMNIANVLYKSEILENWGRGIKLMIDECRRVNIPDPEFHSDGSTVWVVFKYSDTYHPFTGKIYKNPTVTPQLPHSYPTVTPQLSKIMNNIGDKVVSAKEIMQEFALRDKTSFLETYLFPAINQGFVEPLYPDQPKHPRQKYKLTDKGKAWLKENKEDYIN